MTRSRFRVFFAIPAVMAEYPMYNEIYSNPPTPGANAQQQYHHHQQDPSSSTSAAASAGGYPQWETLDPHSHVDHSPMVHDLEEMDTPTPTATTFDFQPHPNPGQMLDDPPHVVPSQSSPVDNAPILLHHPSEVPLHHHRPSPPAHTQMRSYSGQHYRTHTPSPLSPGSQLLPLNAPLPPPPPSSGKTTGPIRSSTRGGRAAQANPYYRPSPSNLSGLATPFGMGGPGTVHSFPSSLASSTAPSPNPGGGTAATAPTTRTARRSSQTVRFSDTNLAPPMVCREAGPRTRAQSQTTKSMPSSSAQPSSQAPRASGSSTSSPQKPTNQGQGLHSPRQTSSVSSSSTTRNQNPTQLPPHAARLPLISIPSDITYSAPDCTLVAHLDIPGVRKEALRITLGTCYFNRVRYVCVLGMRGAEGVGTPSSSGGGSEDLYEILGGKRASSKGKASGDTTTEVTETAQQARRQEEEEEESADDNPSRRPSRDIKEELAGFGIPQSSRAAPTTTPTEARTSTPNPTSQPQVESRSSGKNLTSRLVNPNVRERKFGVMRRVFQVPGTTEVRFLFHNVVYFLSPPPTFAHSFLRLSSCSLYECEFLIGLFFCFSPSPATPPIYTHAYMPSIARSILLDALSNECIPLRLAMNNIDQYIVQYANLCDVILCDFNTTTTYDPSSTSTRPSSSNIAQGHRRGAKRWCSYTADPLWGAV